MDTSNITGIKIWGTDVEKLYIGSELIRPSSTPSAPTTFDDSFTGTSLDTSIWTATQYGTEWSIAVNNGLSISCGSSACWNDRPDVWYKQGYVLTTNALYTWAETKLTAEVTYTGYSWNSYGWGAMSLLWLECRDWPWAMDSATWVIYATWQGWGYCLCYLDNYNWSIQGNTLRSYTTFSNPTTIKCELDITNDTAKMYMNWTLSKTKTGILYSGKTWNDYIGKPLLTISPRYADDAITINISNIKLTTE